MRKLLLLVTLLVGIALSSPTSLALAANVEVFDVQAGKVVHTVPNSAEIQKEIRLCLGSITGLSERVNVMPKEGRVCKIPIEPPVKVENEWVNFLVEEVYLMVSDSEKPLLLLFDDENKPYLVEFSHDIGVLVSLMNAWPHTWGA
ncbi:hypothetical protein [Effusibacillus lacus]|uniref:Uncharacterized protein n=1 Tax=Effusibacillus lacus TaxID=1348429 RepID=A0A292YR12_9BACL|nr:hypothetical protein [Effusibacillus lacus]TCS76860.1 hypothetical protein EDD64_10183 [Effusibacillus lacus]GAX91193.1 hypothetical protein EFBL_2859 [Effusibacillus lacus]